MGNLTKDVELRFLPKGTAVGTFSLAVNRKWRDDSGEEKSDVTFVECKVWQKRAETLAQYVKKGDPLFVSGRLTQETWEDKKTGSNRSKLLVTVENFQFLGCKGERDAAPLKQRKVAEAEAETPADDDSESPVPF